MDQRYINFEVNPVGAMIMSIGEDRNNLPCTANTIGPGLFLQSDSIIGGCDGSFDRGMQWQGMSLWVTLRYEPNMWVPSSFMTTFAGKLFFVSELAGPLNAEIN